MGWEKVACWSTKAAISLKRVKIEEKLLWRAYRKSPTLFSKVPFSTPTSRVFQSRVFSRPIFTIRYSCKKLHKITVDYYVALPIVWTKFHTNLTFRTLLYMLANFESFESDFLDLTKVGLTWLFHWTLSNVLWWELAFKHDASESQKTLTHWHQVTAETEVNGICWSKSVDNIDSCVSNYYNHYNDMQNMIVFWMSWSPYEWMNTSHIYVYVYSAN